MKHLLSAADLSREEAVAILDDADRFSQADRKSTRLNSSHTQKSRMPSSA